MRLRALVPVAVACGVVALVTHARAAEGDDLLREATDALTAERPAEAIAKLEALADRGVVDPVVSYDRGLAYAARVRASAEEPGDLGRAAHGFAEARELTEDVELRRDASAALAIVRAEVARRRARAGEPVELDHGVSLGRSIARLLSENVWAALAALASVALSLGVVLRAKLEAGRARVAAATTCAVAAPLLVVFSLGTYAARDLRTRVREGVVVSPSARLLDAKHIVMGGVDPVPEGARVTVLDEGAGFAKVEAGGREGWLPVGSVRPLAKR